MTSLPLCLFAAATPLAPEGILTLEHTCCASNPSLDVFNVMQEDATLNTAPIAWTPSVT